MSGLQSASSKNLEKRRQETIRVKKERNKSLQLPATGLAPPVIRAGASVKVFERYCTSFLVLANRQDSNGVADTRAVFNSVLGFLHGKVM